MARILVRFSPLRVWPLSLSRSLTLSYRHSRTFQSFQQSATYRTRVWSLLMGCGCKLDISKHRSHSQGHKSQKYLMPNVLPYSMDWVCIGTTANEVHVH